MYIDISIVEIGEKWGIQATLVTSTMHSSTLPLTSTQTPSPNIFPYMFIAFQQRIIRTTVSS